MSIEWIKKISRVKTKKKQKTTNQNEKQQDAPQRRMLGIFQRRAAVFQSCLL